MFRLPRLLKWIAVTGFVLLVVLSIFRLIFFFHYKPEGYAFTGSAFLMGLRLDLRVVSILCLVMLLLSAVPYLNPFKRKGAVHFWNVLLAIIFLLLMMVYIVDFYHYDYLKQRLNASVLNYLQDADITFGMVWETYPVITSLLVMALLVYVIYRFYRFVLAKFLKEGKVKIPRRWIYSLVFIVLLVMGAWGTLGQFPLRWSDVFRLKDNFRAQVALNPIQSFVSTMSFRNSSFDRKKTAEYYAAMADFLGVKNKDAQNLNFERVEIPRGLLDTTGKPNVVLVICESFSSYKSSMWQNPLNPSPYFDSLSRQGIFFDHCFTPSYGTARGVWATVTGIPDVEAPKTSSRNPSLVDQQTILNAFHDYEKFYFIGGSASWANIRGLLEFNIRGLKLFEQDDFSGDKVDVWGVSDKTLFLESNRILAEQEKPFFAIIQTANNHRPYTIPDPDLAEFKKVEYPEDSLKKYGYIANDELNAFRYMDYCIKKFMQAAQKEKYFRNTVFVFIGDHGIRGDAGKMFPKAWTENGLTTVHVPFLFYSPMIQPERRSNICSQLDILPSIAGLLSVPHTNNSLGRNLFDTGLMKDPFRSSSAFIVDPDEHKIGMVAGDHYFRQTIGKPQFDLVSIRNNEKLPPGPFRDSIHKKLQFYSNAFYETSRYLLYHNKKR